MSKQNADLNNRLNTEDINTNLLYLMHINDSAFPIGSYTHSFGMETYIQSDEIRTKEDLLSFCTVYVCENLLYNDAVFVKKAYENAKNVEWAELVKLEKICDASKSAYESREASKKMGKQFLQSILPVTSFESLQLWKEKIDEKEVKGHYSVIYGMYAVQMGFTIETTLLSFMYSSTVALIHNAVRAIPLGQRAGIEVIHKLIPIITTAAKRAEQLSLQQLSNHAIGIELASMQHQFLHSRLFIS
ncbi:urease accessory protein UreF [Bacillus sp. Marseille-P3661]|uniref:urease accessory protein UreF n=1 Tax=Bacillus sp. Marseille-P3661 TaxID=1936234 RepID=UPI00215596EC|nr:urease accessory protein UreF [Bacillus sp. Marseille-P3661]